MTGLDMVLADPARAAQAVELACAAAGLGRPVRLFVRRPALDGLGALELATLAELGGEVSLCAGGAAALALGDAPWPVEGLMGWMARAPAGAQLLLA